MRSLIFFLSSLLFTSSCYGQHLLSFGVKGGVPVSDAFSDHTAMGVDVITHSFSNSKNYTAGLMLELRLPLGFSVEADALYRPLNLTVDTRVFPSFTSRLSNDVHAAEFPILGKYHFLHAPVVSPYIEAGPIFRAVGARSSYLSNDGFAIGGGVDIKLLVLRVSPEIRYSRWGKDATVDFLAAPSNINQAEFLVGLSF
jgi:hypothetical protein